MAGSVHTQGPWRVTTYAKGPTKAVTTRNIVSDSMTIGMVHGDQEWSEANARLIAAAPTMLEALKRADPLGDLRVKEVIKAAIEPWERDTFEEVVASIRAAIALAEGGE